MSDQSIINLEFLKKEAKALLKRCRSCDSEAIGRIRANLPRLAKFNNDVQAAMEIKLADVQHALAREQGYANWGSLKRLDDPFETMDFSKPGSEGVLPDGFIPWRWSVSYTVRPEVLSTLVCGEEYSIGASVLRNRPDDETFTGYSDLYERASVIVRARAAELRCNNGCPSLHTRIVAHTWFRHGSTNLVRAGVTLGVTCLNNGDTGPQSVRIPTIEELAAPGGMTREQLAASGINKKFDEIYSDGDVRNESDTSGIFVFSYGEYVKTVEGIDYKPFVKRAEHLTRFHLRFLKSESPSRADSLNIVRREWFYATNPDIAVIHIYVQR